MSNDRRVDPLANLLGPLDGARVPGGCEHCDAYQTVRAEAAGVWVIDVFHDDGCPALRKAEGRQ
jgi:hypothetical protein